MMTFSRKFKALAIVNSILLLFIVAGIIFSPSRRQDRSEQRSLVSDKVEIMSMDIGGNPGVILDKTGNSWTLKRGSDLLPADANRVSAFLEALKGVNRLEPVSKSKDTWKDFGLDGPQARRIRIFDGAGKSLADFTVGNAASASSDVYITFPGSDASYKASSAFVSYLEGGDTAWLDLTLLPVRDVKAIESADFRGSVAFDEKTVVKSDYSLIRDQLNWKQAGPVSATLDTVKVETMLRSLIAAKGEDFAVSGTPFGVAGATITLNLGTGGKVVLEIGPMGSDKRFPVRTGNGERVMYVASWALREAFKPVADLRK